MTEQTTVERPAFFYYSVPKRPEDMDVDELIEEIHCCYRTAKNARKYQQGISTKEGMRKRNCELALVKLPNGIDHWNLEFAALSKELDS